MSLLRDYAATDLNICCTVFSCFCFSYLTLFLLGFLTDVNYWGGGLLVLNNVKLSKVVKPFSSIHDLSGSCQCINDNALDKLTQWPRGVYNYFFVIVCQCFHVVI